jgi:thioredoxin-dependent peroxiredoxin
VPRIAVAFFGEPWRRRRPRPCCNHRHLEVSPDSERSHARFRDKYELPFTLLSDPDHEVAEEYGVWAEKKFRGRTYWGVVRSTFVIDEDGTVKRALHKVKPDTHAHDVLAILRS